MHTQLPIIFETTFANIYYFFKNDLLKKYISM